MGNPTGSFYRRCLKPKELGTKTCKSIHLPDEDPKTFACEGQSVGAEPLEKGEAEALGFALSTRKIKVAGRENNAITVDDFGCTGEMIDCLLDLRSRLDVIITTDAVTHAMHS